MKRVLLLDDRQYYLDALAKKFRGFGFEVVEALSLRQAKEIVEEELRQKREFDLIVSDFDLSGSLLNKHRWFDGYRFVKWCAKKKMKSRIILHSTIFDSNFFMRVLHRPFLKRAESSGVLVQKKSVLLPHFKRPKKSKK